MKMCTSAKGQEVVSQYTVAATRPQRPRVTVGLQAAPPVRLPGRSVGAYLTTDPPQGLTELTWLVITKGPRS
jgi:hypothetical protein